MYSKYFSIDEEYFPQVTEAEMASDPRLWQKFCAHDTFRELIRSTLSMLEHRLGQSVWIEGAYGTGKSHAALTMLKLFEAAESECRGYFEEYRGQRIARSGKRVD